MLSRKPPSTFHRVWFDLDASTRAGSPREVRLVIEHLNFLLDLWRADGQSETGKARLAVLTEIKDKLQVAMVDL
jgi:hypothetical protein